MKILFRFYSPVLDKLTVETMWAQVVDASRGLYRLDNIPFYAPVACGDLVSAVYEDSEQMFIYQETVECSGNSTVQVVIMNASVLTNEIRDIFDSLGCKSEKFKEGYFAMNISSEQDYTPIKNKLAKLEDEGLIGYAEPCLSDKHWK